MKNTYSVAQRNALVEEHLSCIDVLMQDERKTIRDARLDWDDVYQQLALRLIKAVARFDPDKGELEAHIMAQLHSELRNCLHPTRRSGVPDAPGDFGGKVGKVEACRSFTERREMALAA